MRTYVAGLAVFPVTIFFSLVTLLVLPFSRRTGPSAVMRAWARVVLWMAGIKLNVHGLELLGDKRPAILMSNHASMIDIPILAVALPLHLRFMFKRSLSFVPVLGQVMLLMEMIPVDRGNRKSIRSLKVAGAKVRKGVHLLIFPEGTRTRSGALSPFKKGGFLLALQEKLDIIPVTIGNSQKVCGRSSVLTKPGTVDIFIHPRVETGTFSVAQRAELMEKVRVHIDEGLKKAT